MACETWKNYRDLLEAALVGTTNAGKAPSLRLPDTLPTFSHCKLLYIADSGLMALGIPNGSVAKLGAFMIPLDEGDPNNIFSPILIFIKCECFYIKLKKQTPIDFNKLNSDNAKYADGNGPLKTYSDFVNAFNISGYTWYEAESSASSPMLRGALNIADSYVQTDNSVKVQTIPSGMFTLLKNRDKLNSLQLNNNDVKIENKAENNCLINEKLGIRFPTKNGEFFWYLADIEDDIEKGGLKLTTRPLKQDLQVLDDTYNFYASQASILLRQATNIDLLKANLTDCPWNYRTDVGGMIWHNDPIYTIDKEGKTIDYYIKPYFIWVKQLARDNICYTNGLFTAYKNAIQTLKQYVNDNLGSFCTDTCSHTDPETGNPAVDENCMAQCLKGGNGSQVQCIEVNTESMGLTIIGCPNLTGLRTGCYIPENDCIVVGYTCTMHYTDCAGATLDIDTKDCCIKEFYTKTKVTGEYTGDAEQPVYEISGVQACYSGECGYLYGTTSDTCLVPQIQAAGNTEQEVNWGETYTQQIGGTDYYENKPGGNYHIVYKCCK